MTKKRTNPTPAAAPDARQRPLHFACGTAFLLLAVTASLVLVLKHFFGMSIPGCGIGSGCDSAARSVWGMVPGIRIPTSSMGLAYFAALVVSWIVSGGAFSRGLKWIVRIGALVSFGFLAIIVLEKHYCLYCVLAHAGNLAFWLLMELSGKEREPLAARSRPALIALFVAFAGGVIVLAALESRHRQVIATRAEQDRAETTKRVIDRSSGDNGSNAVASAVHAPPGGFTGRWRLGPENAPIRIVVFSDYQCRDCREIEGQLRTILQQRSDVSLSAKHFPFGAACNKHTGGKTMHANACWAARAAETAGILRGNDGFWLMHLWLFDQGGSFTDENFPISLRQLGFDPPEFLRIMQSQQTLDLIHADVDEGFTLGLHFTPMIFINGVELRGFINNPNALSRTINELAAKNLPPGTALEDKPPLAAAKFVADWAAQPVRALPSKARDWSMGPADAPIKVWVWGDYQLGYTAELDAAIRQSMQERGDIQYTFRQYPADQSCNRNVNQTVSPQGCWAARVAEAAGLVGGPDAYWRMHQWLLANQSQFNEAAVGQAATSLGVSPNALLAAAQSPAVHSTIATDVLQGRPFVLQGVPTIYVNGKWVPRWQFDKKSVLHLIFEEAAKK